MASGIFSQSKMSDETFDFVCTACEKEHKTLEAVKYCVECVGYCCQGCTDLHQKFPTLQIHNLLGTGQGNQAGKQRTSLPEYPTERCSTHPGKVFDMYCEKDDIVGCTTCISKDHRSCPDSQVHSIPDMINALFNLSNSKNAQSKLRELLVSMTTFGKSKDEQLTALNGAKDEALQKIAKFKKLLRAAIKKAAEISNSELMRVYTKLEQEILDDKSECQKTNDTLQETSDKLNKAEGNRAQRFVLTKLAERKITETEKEMREMERRIKSAEPISFTPNQSLLDYINGLQGIGIEGDTSDKKSDLYRIVGSKDINIKVSTDTYDCSSTGCCIISDNQLMVTDYYNKKIKRIDLQTLTLIDDCELDSEPRDVCCKNKSEVVVACGYPSLKIQFVSISNKMTPTSQIKMSHICHGISFKDDKLYITNGESSLYIYDITGKFLKVIRHQNAGNKIFSRSRHITFNDSGDRLYIGDLDKGIVCLDGEAKYLYKYMSDKDIMSGADGVCDGSGGSLFVVGSRSHNVVQFTEDGKKIGVVIKKQDGLNYPCSVCFDKKLNRLFVTMNSNVVMMYELK